jgi:hypothetical protein
MIYNYKRCQKGLTLLMNELIRLAHLVPDTMLWTLCRMAEKLASQKGGEQYREFRKFLKKEPCWVPDSETETPQQQ